MEKTKNLYYIYHIPGKKIGMTRNIYNRVIKCQGYKPGEFQILESSYDKDFIETKEQQWQRFFNYKKILPLMTKQKEVLLINLNQIKLCTLM
jgi:hypothetical protein